MKPWFGDSAVRALFVASIVATAIATHWIDRASPPTAQLVLTEMPRAASEMADAAEWLNGYYASPEGLGRPNGLWTDGHPDYAGIGAWLFDTYLRVRLGGATEQKARAAVIEGIQRSPEWRAKHPDAAPAR